MTIRLVWLAVGLASGLVASQITHAARPACVYAMTILGALS